MPRRAKELSAIEVRRLGPGVHNVGGVAGLLMQVSGSGAQSWLLRVRVGDKRREIGLGPFPEISLAKAREKATEAKEAIRKGIDPVETRKAARSALLASQRQGLTFIEAFEKYAAKKLPELTTERYRSQWKATVEKYAFPELGGMLVQDITRDDILRILHPIWETRTETATKVRQRVEKTLDYAKAAGHRTGDNPAAWRGNLELALSAPSKIAPKENYPALQIDDAARWWADLQSREGIGSKALAFQALTAARSGAVRFATWDEIDLGARLWTIQPGRTASKIPPTGKTHRVPLTETMIELLNTLPRMGDLLFTAPRGGSLSDATLGKAMRTIHEADVAKGGTGYLDAKTKAQAVPHGLRSCFRVWVTERTNFDGDMAEIALAHMVGSKVRQAYDRSDMIEKRRAMMDAWGHFLRAGKSEVPE
ncbi:integrase arm-type DNA-binding domain-containing protein [Sulfitobacter pseudonitzschiae]|uniref:Integrase arm-type DNA-binding domain-containing protein n=1 Tax=Pseudosulfitobacter pseudonitzschiae TaxID=1402135 RepID=A0A9Q2RWG8_9RHOB|nr:integrase arm-type DNA-binding domain-containing protein [Pseudosulfitobacter pseudonitzschiae]MBM2293453.1 integrase arm-type DNA-binding domain-containing protein [Pseudosulfitobacter pseudonitzschiae]MBM2298267.1 integrase arm-type DNA-binding domain-containing protein [Pseudosulfitobacter pseudonitzschiae]MBM2303181.1 integrase arm-type DNA-binding domain-containing protein [Pseudosulfitobacter pseudonitzschiae]MBM2312964.1 integrase arm-type DNA-binding domain-containing protein [Pseudo